MKIKLRNNNPIVFVDDDEIEFAIAKRFLARSKIKNELLTFSSGSEFIDYLRTLRGDPERMPALALIDCRMPQMDGFEVTEAVRAMPEFQELPMIVIFSTSDAPDDMKRAVEAGADDYIVKPDDGEDYLAFLNSLA